MLETNEGQTTVLTPNTQEHNSVTLPTRINVSNRPVTLVLPNTPCGGKIPVELPYTGNSLDLETCPTPVTHDLLTQHPNPIMLETNEGHTTVPTPNTQEHNSVTSYPNSNAPAHQKRPMANGSQLNCLTQGTVSQP